MHHQARPRRHPYHECVSSLLNLSSQSRSWGHPIASIVRRRAPLIAAILADESPPPPLALCEKKPGGDRRGRAEGARAPREDMGPAFLTHVGAHARAEERGVPIVGRDTVADASRCADTVDGGAARMGEEDARIVVAREGGRMR